MYNGSEIAHSNEMSRSYSYTWHIGDHVLRLDIFDIVEVGTQVAKGSGKSRGEGTNFGLGGDFKRAKRYKDLLEFEIEKERIFTLERQFFRYFS